MLLKLILLGTLQVTSYRAVPEQTKPECLNRHQCETSIGDGITQYGVAVSQDLLDHRIVHYGDILYIPGYGYKVVNDCMNRRHNKAVDMLVFTHAEEKKIGIRYLKVYLIHKEELP